MILWIEDDEKETTDLGRALQDHFTLCKADWSTGPQHSISAGIRYLLELTIVTGCKLRPPDLILLDSKLDIDINMAENLNAMKVLCGSNTQLYKECETTVNERNGGGVLAFLGRYVSRSYPDLKVVYASNFGIKDIRDAQGGEILRQYPGVLSGYFWKPEGPTALLAALFEILNDPKRGISFAEIRKALPPEDAYFLLGKEEDQYAWSDTYRLALTDLVRAGADRAWVYQDTRMPNMRRKYFVEGESGYTDVLKSHKNLSRALILAERGSGKEGFARALHHMWYTGINSAPLVSVNIGGVPPWSAGAALALRLFGGQQNQNQQPALGCVPMAWNGTLFLDELGDAKPEVQDTLLRLIQEGEYEPVMWNHEVWAAHCAFIGATNRDLWGVEEFRQDVADRLAMHVIRIPALRNVKEDIPIWMDKIAKKLAAEHNATALQPVPPGFEFSEVASNILQSYSWPGNIRELTHAIRRMQMRSAGRAEISLSVVVSEVSRLRQAPTTVSGTSSFSLPTNEVQLQAFVRGAAEFVRHTNKKTIGKSDIVRYVESLIGKPIRVDQLRVHFDRTFGEPGLDNLVQMVADCAKFEVWGTGKSPNSASGQINKER
jgi:hypothetical protein